MAAEHETRQPDLHLVPKPAALAAADRAPVSDQTAPGIDNVPQHPVTAESLLAARLSGAGEASRTRIAFQLQRLAGNEALQRVVAAKPKPKLTSVKVANAKAFGAPDNYVTTLNAPVVVSATLNVGGAGLGAGTVVWTGGNPGGKQTDRQVVTTAAGLQAIKVTVGTTSKNVNIYVVDAAPLPAVSPAATLTHTLIGASAPGTDFGLTVVTIGTQGVVGPEFDVTAYLDGNNWKFRVTAIRHKYKVGVSAQGRTNIAGPGDPAIKPSTIALIITDLTPPAPGTPHGPPRTTFWSETITRAHEQAHVDHFYTDPAFWPKSMKDFQDEIAAASVAFDPGAPKTSTGAGVIADKRPTWQGRADFFHGQADAAEIPGSETYAHGVSNPQYTVLLNSIKDTVVPPAPTGLAVAPVGRNGATLTWTRDAANETGFEIQRIESGFFGPLFSSWVTLAPVAAAPLTFTDSGLKPATKYTYRVAAKGVAGNSAFSTERSATTAK